MSNNLPELPGFLSFPIVMIVVAVFFLVFVFWDMKNKAGRNSGINRRYKVKNPGRFYTILAIRKRWIRKDQSICLSEHSRYGHTQVMGSTGSGKTRYAFFPSILQDIKRGAGCFILDVKSNSLETVGSYIHHFGRDKDFYYFDIASPYSMTYNPLSGDHPDEISNRINSALYPDTEKSEQYYRDVGKRFIQSLVSVLFLHSNKITFRDLYEATTNLKKLEMLCEEHATHSDAIYLLNN